MSYPELQIIKHKNNKSKSEMKHETLTFRFLDMSRGGFARLFLLLLLPCLCVIGVKAADSNGGVKFNSGVRYSQWAINSRLHDFYGNQKAYGFAKWNSEKGSLEEYANKKNMKLDYVAGLVGKATLETSDYYVDFDWAEPWFKSAQAYATDYHYSAQEKAKMTLDNMNAAKMYFPILAGKLKSQEATTVANNAIAAVIKDMKTYNTTYIIGSGNNALNNTNANDVQKTMFGGWFHKSTDYTDQMWCDGQYMGPALLAQIIKHTGKTNNISDNDWDIIAKQFSITWAQLYDKTTGLLYHGFTANPGDDASTSWAGISKEKGIYHSASFWGRANAWYFLALVDILEVMPTNNTYYNTFKDYLTSLAQGIAKYQDKDTGCWYQVMDKVPASLTGNYLEASCSSIFTAGYLKAIRLGLLDKATYEPIAKKAYEGLVNQFMIYDNTDNSTIQLVHSCTSAGLGGKDSRAGDDNYYLKGKDASVVTSSDPTSKYYYTEGKVLGGFIMAATEYERAYQNQNQDNKQILFAKDLAPSYNFTTTAGTLDATAYGSDDVTYQWYKSDGTEIEDATSATFAPKESGKYYCKATSGSTFITTNTADVTANSSPSTTKYTVSATAGEGGTVSIKNGNEDVTSGSTVVAGSTITFTANPASGYKFKNWTVNNTTNNETSTTLTISKIAANTIVVANFEKDSSTETETTSVIFDYTVPTTTDIKEESSYEATGGTVNFQKATKTDANGYKLDKDTKYIRLNLNKTLAVGDVITIQAYATSNNGGIIASASTSTATNQVIGTLAEKNKKLELTYTVKEQDILNGQKTIYLFRNNSVSTYIQAIKITRANTQVALTASFSPATISGTEGDAAQNLPALTVKAGETTLTANDYTVTYASDNNTVAKVENGKVCFVGEGETNIVATIKPNDTNKYKEISATFAVKVEKKQTPVTPTEDDVIYNWNTIGSQKENIAVTEGTKNINGTSVPCINFGSNYNASRYTYMSIKDKYNGGFKVGDIITITGLYTGNKTTGIGMEIHTTRDGKAVFSTPYYNKELQTYTYTLTEDCDSLFFGRYGGATPNVTVLKVVRPAASAKLRLSANFDTNNIKVVTGTTSITLPNLTVKAGSTELTANDYTVNYESDANEIAALNGTQVNFVPGKTGLVTITAKVTPNDAAKYEETKAYYQILIQDPTPLNISVTDIDMNTTDAEIKEPVVKVYGENDQLLKLGTDYTLSYSVSNGGPVSFPDGKLTVAGNKYNWTEGVSTITVTATPKESLGKKYKEGSVDFTYTVNKGLITPKFLDVFNDAKIKLAVKTGGKDNFNTFTVPLIYDGEDVSSYFDYTYEITSTSTANTQNVNGNMLTYYPKNAGTYTVKVSATVKKNEKDPTLDYTDVYAAPTSITFTLDVNATYIRPVVKLNPVSVNMYTGTREDAPDVTITNYKDNSVIDASTYKVSWTTFTPGICKVDANGNIEAVSEGDGEVRVTVTGAKMESTTAFLKVLVDDPAMYRVKGTGNYGNQTRMGNQDKTLSVVLGGWMFPNDGTPDTKILDQTKQNPEKLSNSYQWDKTSTKAKWKLTGFDYYVSGNNSKNARQENGSNAMPETTTIGSADFKTYTKEVKDPMFNVPCSGSFLVFNPKTNGKVTAHIFQNGVFDTSGGKYSYRPQRRVFVMDEAGNFVSSTAHIESTNGKPTGGVYDLTKYGWDLNGGKAPTEAEVASHFDGLESFVMTQDGFKNNVYPSALSNDIMPNNKAITNHPYDKSAHGWCVLADSPVTYTFNVKAGKTYYLYNFGSKIGFYGFSFDEDETKPTVDEVSYADNSTNDVKATETGHVAKVSINRSMKAGIWTTCVLPFSLNKEQVDAIFGETYSATAPQGTQILYFDHVEGNKVFFVRHAYNTIVAGKPFLIKPTKEVTSINTAEVTNYPYVTIENTKPEDWCSDDSYTWASSYSNDMTVREGDGFISNKDGSFKNFVGASGTLKGFRGYLKRLNTPTGAKPTMLQVVSSSNIEGDNGETTGIEDLIIDADGQLMPANGKVYNINGQLVSEDANSFQSLPSGIYIINGKKYIK